MHKIQRTKNTMMNNRQHHSIGRHVVKSCPLLRRGSRRGYYADVDDKPPPDSTRDDDDEEEEEEEEDDEQVDVAIDSKGISRTRISFYSHVQPKKRRCRGNNEVTPWQRQSGGERTSSSSTSRTTKKHHHYWTTHPDIDLSLVSLLSSRELDRRMTRARGGREGRGDEGCGDSRSSSSSLSDQSPSSTSVSPDTGSNTDKKNEKDNGSRQKLQNVISSSSENVIFTKARPLAVVDYGSIELDMSGSLLDSIYKIGPPSTTGKSGGGSKDDWSTMIDEGGGGGRKRRHNQLFPSSAHKKYESIRSMRRHDRVTTTSATCSSSAVTAAFDVTAIEHQISRIEQTRKVPTPARDEVVQVDARCDTSSCAHSPLSKDRRGATTINSSEQANLLDDTSSSCAVQVQNISSTTLLGSSRRSHFTTTTTTPPMTHEGGCTTTETRTVVKKDSGLVSSNAKARRKMKVYGILPTISKVPTTLEAAISFSPFARVLFSAHPPYTVVHTNAAYVSLVQQRSTTNPCLVGGAFTGNTTMQQIDGESSETCVARMVMEHMQELDADVSDDEASNLRRTRNPSLHHQPRPGLFYYIFPVLSVNDPYSQFLRGYTHDFERRQGIDKQKTETSMTISNSDVTATTASSSITSSTSILDLSSAVEPQGSSSNNGGSRSTSPIQFRMQYLLQIEPDNRYPY